MSVKHFMLPVTDTELEAVLSDPDSIRGLVERREADIQSLGTDGQAIIVLTTDGKDDPLAFLHTGAPPSEGGWVGAYAEADGRVVTCQVDMGYGPASYYRNTFLRRVARRLEEWPVEEFARRCDLDWLEDHYVYPSGWHDEGRRDGLSNSFAVYRECVMSAARSGKHLLVWCA